MFCSEDSRNCIAVDAPHFIVTSTNNHQIKVVIMMSNSFILDRIWLAVRRHSPIRIKGPIPILKVGGTGAGVYTSHTQSETDALGPSSAAKLQLAYFQC